MGEEALEIRPNPGPQERFLRTSAREALFGGAAGPGKSFGLLLGATRFISQRTYRAILFRRTFPELEKSLIERSHDIYPHLGGRYVGDKYVWVFPSGARIRFGYLEHEKDKLRYDGAEFQHVGFDELTGFTRTQYLFLFSRLRSAHGIPTFMRATTNPGGPGHEWVLERFAPWIYARDYHGYRGPYAEPGQVLFFRSNGKGGEVVCDKDWHSPVCPPRPGASPSELCAPGRPCARHKPRSRTYIPARLADNPYLVGTDYETNLEELDPVTKAQKRDGDWLSRPEAGRYFQRANLPLLPARPARVIARVRYWDRAATDGGGDWTVGVLMSVLEDGHFVVEDVVRVQLGPGGVEATIRATAQLDPTGTEIGIEQDPASAGKFEAVYYVTQLAGFNVHALPPQGDKITRAAPVSAQAAVKNLCLVQGAWNEEYIRELEGFPAGTKDQVDATSGAFRLLLPALLRWRSQTGGGGINVRVLRG